VTIQLDQKQNLDCTTQVLFDVVAAVNSRTTYTTDQTNSNIELIKAQLEFLTRFSDEPPPTDEEAIQVYNQYVAAVTAFLTLAEKTRDQQIQNPYPTVEDLTTCLKQTNADTKEPSQ
jgi:hypothetical protein